MRKIFSKSYSANSIEKLNEKINSDIHEIDEQCVETGLLYSLTPSILSPYVIDNKPYFTAIIIVELEEEDEEE